MHHPWSESVPIDHPHFPTCANLTPEDWTVVAIMFEPFIFPNDVLFYVIHISYLHFLNCIYSLHGSFFLNTWRPQFQNSKFLVFLVQKLPKPVFLLHYGVRVTVHWDMKISFTEKKPAKILLAGGGRIIWLVVKVDILSVSWKQFLKNFFWSNIVNRKSHQLTWY